MHVFARVAAVALALTVGALPSIAEAQRLPPGQSAAGGPDWRLHRGGPQYGGPRHYNGGPRYYGGGPRYYHGGPRYYHHDDDGGAALAAGIVGLAAGAMIAGAASGNGHVARCSRTYRSYDPDSDTFIDRHGNTRRCRL